MIKEKILELLNFREEDFPEPISFHVSGDGKYVEVLTNSGGDHRIKYYDMNEKLRNHPLHVGDSDAVGDDKLTTLAILTFEVPEDRVSEFSKLADEVEWCTIPGKQGARPETV